MHSECDFLKMTLFDNFITISRELREISSRDLYKSCKTHELYIKLDWKKYCYNFVTTNNLNLFKFFLFSIGFLGAILSLIF